MAGGVKDPAALADCLDCDPIALVAFLRRNSTRAAGLAASSESKKKLATAIADTDTSPPHSDRAYSVPDFENVQGVSIMEERGLREVFSNRFKDDND